MSQPIADPVIRARALAHVIFTRRKADVMARFLVDFGFVALGDGYFRAHAAGQPWSVQVVPGDIDQFSGLAFEAEKAEDLEVFAAATGRSVQSSDAPGGGKVVTTADPGGLSVQLVFGADPVPALGIPAAPDRINRPGHVARVNQTVRPPVAAAPVFKLGHIVLQTPAFGETAAWYARHFGLIASDVAYLPDGSPVLGFYRLDRGDEPTDHHTLALLAGGSPGLLHVSTETSTLNALGQGQRYLREKGWTHHWGIGRHELGSQVFDYWKDPAGDEWEHYIDGDMFTASHPAGRHGLSRGELWTWGHDLPDTMRPGMPMEAIPEIHASGGFGTMTLAQAVQFIEALKAPPRPWLQ